MNAEQVEAMGEAAADGIDFDGFEVERDEESVVVATADGSETVVHESDLAAVAEEYADYVTNWYFWHAVAPQAEPRWAFLRWLEAADDSPVPDRYSALADGHTHTWGQLVITATLGEDGRRQYRVCHVDDRDAVADDLTAYTDPLDARSLAKHDPRGRYRPLKTVPSLQSGWAFRDLGPAEVVRAIECFYPATIANWHRERSGTLDVTHWHETMARQTGMYGLIETWDRQEGYEHVNWVAEACCDDSQCLKRREWDYDEETPLDVDGGDGEFPCREPCSLVVAAARQWTKLESEESRTYEFELTPSEKAQIEELIDAVAEGRVADIREADVYDDANRYRTRFLRAKRFDDDGNLCGVPTEPETDDAAD